jgi:hypothetical protein
MLSFLRSLIHPSLLGYEHPIPYGKGPSHVIILQSAIYSMCVLVVTTMPLCMCTDIYALTVSSLSGSHDDQSHKLQTTEKYTATITKMYLLHFH